MRIRVVAAAIGTLLVLGAIGACTRDNGGGGSASGAAGSAAVDKVAAAAPGVKSAQRAAGASGSSGSGSSGSGSSGSGSSGSGSSGSGSSGSGSSGSGSSGSGSSGSGSSGLAGDVVLGRAEIRTAQMSVTIRHGQSVGAKADAATAIATRVGGEVDSDDRTSGKDASATLVLRVPPNTITPTLNALAQLGIEQSRELSTQDVTSKVADVNSRVTSARDSIARSRVLYTHAVKVSDVIAIETELAERESDLESLEAQQRALDAQTSMATITLSLVSAGTVPPVRHSRSGFVGGLEDGWDAFAGAAAWVATAVGAVLPFLVLLAVVALAARLLWPRLGSRLRPRVRAPRQDNA